jgi:putative hemolysin
MAYLTFLILLCFSAFFSAAETAITSVSRIRMKQMVSAKKIGSKSLLYLKDNPAKALSTVLLGNNLVNVGASVLAASLIMGLLNQYGLTGVGLEVGIATGIITFLILVFGEIIPKTIALRHNEFVSLIFAPAIRFVGIIFYPVLQVLALISAPFVFVLSGGKSVKGTLVTEEDVKVLLSMGEKEGVIKEDEREMIHGVFEIGETAVREVMTPRPDMICVSATDSVESVIALVNQEGHSRFPVFDGTPNNIIGLIYAKDLLKLEEAEKVDGVRLLLRPALFIPESKKVDELMHQMQAAKTHIAIVVDEYGETSGLVTLEDLIEEIVGEIHDEFEREERLVEKLEDSSYLVDAKLSIEDVNDRLKINLPTGEYDTVGGYVFEALGKLPSVGSFVRYQDLLITVEKVLKRRITRIKISRNIQRSGEEAVGG